MVSASDKECPSIENSRCQSIGTVLTAPAYEAVRGVALPEGPALAAIAAWMGVATRVPSGVFASTRDPSTDD